MKLTSLSALSFGIFASLVNADANLEVSNTTDTPTTIIPLDLGVPFDTFTDPNIVWRTAISARVLNIGRRDPATGMIEANNCTAFQSRSCTGSPSFTITTLDIAVFQPPLAGNIGCYLCL